MIFNFALLILEPLILGSIVLALHRISPRYGLTPLIALVIGLTAFVQSSAMTLVYLQLAPQSYMVISATEYIPVILLAVLLLYVVDGTIPARLTITCILGTTVLYFLLLLSNKFHLSLAGGGSFLELTPNSPFLSPDLRSTLASLLAFAADLFIIAIVYQAIKNHARWIPAWVVPGLALLVSLWSDTLLYQAISFGLSTSSFFAQIWDDLLGKTLIGLVLWPLASLYLTRVAPRLPGYRGQEGRSTLDLLFGPIGGMEVALARTEAALRESEVKFRSIFEQSSDGIVLCDEEGRVVAWNHAIEQLTGLSSKEVLGQFYWDVQFKLMPAEEATPAAYKRIHSTTREVLRTGQADWLHKLLEGKLRTPGGEYRYFQQAVFPIRTSKGFMVSNITRDITGRMRNEAEREGLIAELESKNAELERFTYTVSHDLKAPLITIRGFLGYAEKDAQAGNLEQFRADMARIVEATNRMNRLLTELLELSRIGRMMNPPVNIPFETIVREALALIEGPLKEGKVRVVIEPDLPIVHGDESRLVEVMQNLLDNAAKFMGNQPDPLIRIGYRLMDGQSVFYVQDNGIGIEPQYHEKIFGLFNKLDSKSEGTGVGLALVKRIVEVHGGWIRVESESGKGATFYFTLEPGLAGESH
jgi:two-component system, LuxR family, sensor kinase FixL